jgi:ferredoxin
VPGAPLVIRESNVSQSTDGGRAQRLKLRRRAKELLPTEAIGACGTCLHYLTRQQDGVKMPHAVIMLTRGEEKKTAFVAGIAQCGRIWDCAVCSARISAGRRDELGALVKAHVAAEGRVYMAAMTIPHGKFDDLKVLRRAVSRIWTKVQTGRAWMDAKQRCGLIGMVRAMEVTHGKNGWHPHLHILFFFGKNAPTELIELFGKWLFERWAARVYEAGHGECNINVFQFEQARSTEQAAGYAVKWGSEHEMLGAQGKAGKNGNKTPWQLLIESAAGNKRSGELFVAYSKGMKGARQLTYTKGLRKFYALPDEKTDEELAAEPTKEERDSVDGGKPRPVCQISGRVLFLLEKRGVMAAMLEAVEADPCWETVRDFLETNYIHLDFLCGPPFSER